MLKRTQNQCRQYQACPKHHVAPTEDLSMNTPFTTDARRPRRHTKQLTRSTVLPWIVRICFTFVFIINVQCACSYIMHPTTFAPGFDLPLEAGSVAVAGMGVAFLMWNTTYPAFIISPQRFTVLGWVILAQQCIGLIGETIIYFTLPASSHLAALSIQRFIAFDALGLVLMSISFLVWFIYTKRK